MNNALKSLAFQILYLFEEHDLPLVLTRTSGHGTGIETVLETVRLQARLQGIIKSTRLADFIDEIRDSFQEAWSERNTLSSFAYPESAFITAPPIVFTRITYPTKNIKLSEHDEAVEEEDPNVRRDLA